LSRHLSFWTALLWAASGVASAMAQPAGDLRREYDAAFAQMLQKPADLDVLFKFAAVAAQTGDLEGAISALERMLIVNADLPRVRLELGVLYYRLGSFEIARSYLESALKSATVPPDVRSRAEQFLAEVDKQRSRSRFSGEFFLGMRHQSNANLGPATSTVRLFGQAANLNQASLGNPDWGHVGSGQIRHYYDLGTQDKTVIETQLTGYANRQLQVSAANVSLLDFTTGPRFQAFQGIFEDVTIKPFAALGHVWVNDTPFYGSYGAGVEVAALLSDRLRNTTILVWRQQNYPDTSYLPTNSQFTGVQYTGSTNFVYKLSDIVGVFLSGNLQRYQTQKAPWQNYTLEGLGGGFVFSFTDPILRSRFRWTLSLAVTQQFWQFDAPDPTVDPNTFRTQSDTILGIVLGVPLDERTTLSISGGRFNRAATLANYEFVNNDVMVGITWRF
jgi:hypothetical protein